MEDDWDLHAVVRGCATATATTTATTATSFAADLHPLSCFSPYNGSEQGCSSHLFSLPDPFEARYAIEELHDLYKPFFPKSQPFSPQTPTPMSSFSSLVASKEQTQIKHLQPKPKPKPKSHSSSVTAATTNSASASSTSRSKRRKNQLKKVCQVPAESLSSDVWAWRKYGQKPIKGSPYPRGYYRCSSSKGCLARKQVERNRSDPGMFIVTYTAEHNHPAPTHRNSLAGSTRQKPFTPQTVAAGDSNKPSSASAKPSSSSSATSMEDDSVPPGTNMESREDLVEDDEVDDLPLSDMVVSDDFFVGLEGLTSPENGDYFSDYFPASFGLPWLPNNAATSASSI